MDQERIGILYSKLGLKMLINKHYNSGNISDGERGKITTTFQSKFQSSNGRTVGRRYMH